MKSKLAVFALLVLFIVSTTLEGNALTSEKLPLKQTSKQWSVKVDQAKSGKEAHAYTITIDKIGKDVGSVEIQLFRNEPNSKTQFALLPSRQGGPVPINRGNQAISLASLLNHKQPVRVGNFPLPEKATELEVDIVWTPKKAGRPLKETFTFNTK